MHAHGYFRKIPSNQVSIDSYRTGILYDLKTQKFLSIEYDKRWKRPLLTWVDLNVEDGKEFVDIALHNLDTVSTILTVYIAGMQSYYPHPRRGFMNIFGELRAYGSNKSKQRAVDKFNDNLQHLVIFEIDTTLKYVFSYKWFPQAHFCYLYDAMIGIDFTKPVFGGYEINDWEKEMNHYFGELYGQRIDGC